MLQFKPLALADIDRLRPYFSHCTSRICDTTPGSSLIWRDMYHTEWAIYGDSLYFKVLYPGLGETFTLPLGGDREEHYCQIADYCCRRNMPIAFYPVSRDELDTLQNHFPNSAAIAERDNFDYLYRAEDLKYFRGKKLSGQRNHVNRFQKTYGNWTFRPIGGEDIPAVKAFLDRYASRWDKSALSFHEDIAKTHEILDNMQTYDLLGGMLLVEGEIAGFSLGEVLGDTLFIHVEKADRDYLGGYQMLVSQFAQQFAVGEVQFINREDDTGDPGLRTSKLSYHPITLLEKFTVTVEEPCAYCETCAQCGE